MARRPPRASTSSISLRTTTSQTQSTPTRTVAEAPVSWEQAVQPSTTCRLRARKGVRAGGDWSGGHPSGQLQTQSGAAVQRRECAANGYDCRKRRVIFCASFNPLSAFTVLSLRRSIPPRPHVYTPTLANACVTLDKNRSMATAARSSLGTPGCARARRVIAARF